MTRRNINSKNETDKMKINFYWQSLFGSPKITKKKKKLSNLRALIREVMRLDLSFGMIFIDYFMETGLSGDKRGNRPDRRLIQLSRWGLRHMDYTVVKEDDKKSSD